MRGEFVDLGGVRVYCYAFGSRGAGEPIVLVHGAFTSSHLWQDLLPRLPKGHRVLVLDLLGHGRSDPPRHASMTLAGHADRLAALLDVMGVRASTLVGHGFGAAIAARVALLHPTRVTRLALVNPTLLTPDARDARVSRRIARLAALAPVWRRLAPEWLASALHGALLPAYAQKTSGAHSLDLYLKSFRTREGRDAACAQLVAFRHSRADAGAPLAPGAISCPVTLALGVSDPMLPEAVAARLERALLQAAGGRLVVQRLSGVAHVAPEEAPDRLGTMIAELMTQ
ncbi:MAG TPA: alpha/beta hydrolase [Gemmatimonas sp.]|nr:alpha/beta hydrolase [Gemmatimonas sp.]